LEETRIHTKHEVEYLKGRNHLGAISEDESVILKLFSEIG
jgi:hypothetical protein